MSRRQHPPLLLGATTLDITPPAGHPMDGYAGRLGPATGTADPLRATLVWLSTEDDSGVLWLSLDAVATTTELATELAEAAATATGIPAERVLVCASHTHSGPSGWSGRIHPVMTAEREPDLVRALTTTVATAEIARIPVTASWRSTEVRGVGTNRHHLDGPHDATVGILALTDQAGTTAAVLVDFACHPTAYGAENLLWSADWPGAARDRLDSPVVGFLQGAAGDVSPRFTRQGRDAAEIGRLGGLLATAVNDALAEGGIPLPSIAPTVRRTTIRLPVRELPSPEEVSAMVDAAEAAVRSGDGPAARIARTRLEGARGQAAMLAADLPAELVVPITVVSLGHVAWIHLPVEPFAIHGRRLQDGSEYGVTRVIGYTDGYFGYLVDAEARRTGTYEALISYFDPAATDRLLAAATTLSIRAPSHDVSTDLIE
ncbi:neutral/alkaline ceramidase-like enzyme [Kribbella amoyensis]|uniref:Neutral/alkaline ceramidase-like enzyme n=1 Tax=Kribbella amoyensis TaxID=996641 RepID=A0A561BXH0_9ACTN|nr:neutral/alkaline non-lysosomal ceramidase N-terminal domain-containing protein [Kribbella amoyensis]TWD83586.1 neutral/alkaline ceramidase-like enzyme [Kribbella amoyensis]